MGFVCRSHPSFFNFSLFPHVVSDRFGSVCCFRRDRSEGLAPAGPGHAEPEAPAARAPRGPRSRNTGAENAGPAGTDRTRGGRSQRSGGRGGGWGRGRSPVGPDCGPALPPAAGRPEPASLSRSPTVMVADQRLPRVPAESGTILRLCALLLGAGETKRKCQEHVNQTRYSVTITSLSGLPGPQNPQRTPHTGPTPARGPRALPGDPPALVSFQPQSWHLGQAQERGPRARASDRHFSGVLVSSSRAPLPQSVPAQSQVHGPRDLRRSRVPLLSSHGVELPRLCKHGIGNQEENEHSVPDSFWLESFFKNL